MAETPQTYANHTRWHAPYHFFVVPVLLANFIVSVAQLVRYPGVESGWLVVVSAALFGLAGLARINPIRVQDRVIRLEETLRYQRLLPADLARRAGALTVAQTVALRFASDEELEGLVREVLEGRLTKPKEIKQAVRNWRADTLRV